MGCAATPDAAPSRQVYAFEHLRRKLLPVYCGSKIPRSSECERYLGY
jgi:hypothetical protein